MAKKAATTRVHQLARELSVDSKAIVAKCQAEDIPDIVNHMSIVSAGLSATIREWFSGGSAHTAVEQAAAVDVAKARATARKRTRKTAAAAVGDDSGASTATATAVAEMEPPTERATTSRAIGKKASGGRTAIDDADAHASQSILNGPDALHQDIAQQDITDRVTSRIGKAVERRTGDGQAAVETTPARRRRSETPAAEGETAGTPESPVAIGRATGPAATGRPSAGDATSRARPPILNKPQRPTGITPAGPMLQQPTKTKLSGPKVIRVETPDILPAPRSRSAPRTPPPMSRGGPRAGRGAGMGAGAPSQDMPDLIPGRSDRGGADSSRRNKRRTRGGAEETGRTGRAGQHFAASSDDRPFNWRDQDLLERERRLNRSGGFFKQARRDNLKRSTGGGHRAVMAAEAGGIVKITAPISIKDLSLATGIKVPAIVKKLFMAGKMVTINSFLNAEAAIEAVMDYHIDLQIVEQRSAEQKISDQFTARQAVDERRRSPVVTILGHVDHGKTSLLDRIRDANVAAGEAGGITQATSAFRVPVKVGDETHQVTFIDTPGHEAFTEMRSRGAKVTDVVVLVVAADDGVMPQTVESINHAKAAGVPIVVALNKIDKPEATDSNIQRILGQLAEHQLNPVEWGGSTEVVRTSALKNTGIQDLLEVLDYQAQLLDLKADFGGDAQGTVLEASVQEGRGAVARVLVQQGTLKKGDFVVVGRAFGRVRDIVDDRGRRLDEATPSTPIAFSGINDVPDAGDSFYVAKSLKGAEEASLERVAQERQRDLAKEKVTLDNVFKHLEATGKKELPLVIKADVQGSVETLRTVLARISTDEITVAIKHAAVGGVNESDITLAEATGAIIVGFNVTASVVARKAAEARGVDIRFYDVIYDLTDDVTRAAEGLLEPELKLEVLGHAEVREVFKISRVGQIAGCYVTDGVIERNAQIRVTRGGIVIEKDRRLHQLKRFKDDAKEVRAGQECGMNIEGYSDIKAGDVLECYKTREVKRKL